MSGTLPGPFLDRMEAQLGEDFSAWQSAMAAAAPLSIRRHPHKWTTPPDLAGVPWCATGYYLPERPRFALDPAWHAGAYYVQEASSMLLEAALRPWLPEHPLVALDLCGAPGGKSTHLTSLLPPGSLLVANEVIRARANVLVENLSKWGPGNAVVTNQDPKSFGRLPDFFDVILVDAPCSGEGLFRKDAEAIKEWSPEHVTHCAARQQRILADIWPSLRPGGLLLYSTCTWSEAEDEAQVRQLQSWGAEVLSLDHLTRYGVEVNAWGGRCYPQRVRGEGFFLALLRKPGAGAPRTGGKHWRQLTPLARKHRDAMQCWLAHPETWTLLEQGNLIWALPTGTEHLVDELRQVMPTLYAGVDLAEVKGKDLRPAAAAAWWTELGQGPWQPFALDLSQARAYLRRLPLQLPAPRGWLLMTFEGLPLGWAKGLGNRINNAYPQPWRLRMAPAKEEGDWSALR